MGGKVACAADNRHLGRRWLALAAMCVFDRAWCVVRVFAQPLDSLVALGRRRGDSRVLLDIYCAELLDIQM
jgi:hypothetical protein